jgi:Spy/CpxP family protein refolding chaperone
MKKLLIGLLLALSVLPLTAFAEPDMDNNMAEKRVERMTKTLDLNAEQKTKIEAIFKAQREKFKALQDETHASIKAVLTPEQATKFDAQQEKRQEMRKERIAKRMADKNK